MKKGSILIAFVMVMTIFTSSVSASTNNNVNLEDSHLLSLLEETINSSSQQKDGDSPLQVTQIVNEIKTRNGDTEITYATTSLVLTDEDDNLIQTYADYDSQNSSNGSGYYVNATNTIYYTIRISGINVDSIRVNSVSTRITNATGAGNVSIQHGYHIVIDYGVKDLMNTGTVSFASVGTAYNVRSLHSGFYQRDSGPGANRIYSFATISTNGRSFNIITNV